MAIFRRFVEDMLPLVPTIWRRKANNLLNITFDVFNQAMDSVAVALTEYIDAWPIDTAPGWLLDAHWGPYHNLLRNGLSDADYRIYIHAKRLLNKSWGAGDQALEIFHLLLPTADLSFTYSPPKSWTINITGVDMATAAPAVLFMTKGPSPVGGGFSAAGDNGNAVVVDAVVFSYNSTYDAVPPSVGWYSSVYYPGYPVDPPPPDAGTAGWAHVSKI